MLQDAFVSRTSHIQRERAYKVYPSEIAIDPGNLVAFAPVLDPATPERAVAGGKYSSSTLSTRTTQEGDAQGSEVVVRNCGTDTRAFSASTGIFLLVVDEVVVELV